MENKKKVTTAIKNVKDGAKNIKNISNTAGIVKNSIGTGLKILDGIAPDQSQKVVGTMNRVQSSLEEHGGVVEELIDKFQNIIDKTIGDKLENTISGLERKIDEKGGKKVEDAIFSTISKVEDAVKPIIQKTSQQVIAGSKKILENVKNSDTFHEVKDELESVGKKIKNPKK